jgi:hypothetical protein
MRCIAVHIFSFGRGNGQRGPFASTGTISPALKGYANAMRIEILPDRYVLAAGAASDGAAAMRAALDAKGECTIIVATGASQFEMLTSGSMRKCGAGYEVARWKEVRVRTNSDWRPWSIPRRSQPSNRLPHMWTSGNRG